LRLVALGVVLAAAGLIALVLVLGARDDPEVAGALQGPGELQPDRGSGHDAPAQVTDPWPTSGPHRPELVTRDRRRLSDDQILHALELGNVVLLYEEDPGALADVQRDVAGPFDAEIAAAGQAVILARRPGPTAALAWRRVLRSDDPSELREFAEAWLGRGLGR
jgi:Protein of unknown function (DUF3105)